MLRDYQLRAIDMVRAAAHKRPLLVVPTGGGKTSVAAEIMLRTVAKGRRAIFMVHRVELVEQAVARLAQFGVRAGRIIAGREGHSDRPVQVASIPTLVMRPHWPSDVVIVDEAHHAISESWKKVLDRYPPPSIVVGLTATPIRLDGKPLGDLFGCIVEPVTTRELIQRGYLVEPKVYAPPVDLSNLPTRGGDYNIPELVERVSGLTGSIVGEWQKHAAGMSTVVFAVNVEHSQAIVGAFEAIGVKAAHVDYKMGRKQRAAILAGLRDGALDMVSQVSLLSEGWDLPTLQCCVLARPTKSLALFRQMVGRVMRPPGPVLVLDHAGNHHEHGLVTTPIEWSLDGPAKRPAASLSVRTCKVCFATFEPGPLTCPACGALLATEARAEAPAVHNPGELVALDMTAVDVPVKATRDEKREAYTRMVKAANEQGKRLVSARGLYKGRFGVWPSFPEIEREHYKCSGHTWRLFSKAGFEMAFCQRCQIKGGRAELNQARAAAAQIARGLYE